MAGSGSNLSDTGVVIHYMFLFPIESLTIIPGIFLIVNFSERYTWTLHYTHDFLRLATTFVFFIQYVVFFLTDSHVAASGSSFASSE